MREPTSLEDLKIQVHHLFTEQAQRTPDAMAVTAATGNLSYGQLLDLARGWARRLRACGVKPNTLVAIVMEKGWEQIAAVLGILESGAAYLPVDCTVPQERLWYLLENGEVEIVLTQSWVNSRLSWPENVVRFSVDQVKFSREECGPIEAAHSPDDIAYVLYTSGSTGNPKGAMIAHRGLVNCILETNREFGVTAEDRVLGLTALHHDMSVYDIFGVLAVGGTLVLPSAEGTRAPDHWLECIRRERVTIWNSVPALMEMLLVYAEANHVILPDHLRLAFLGGDWIPLSSPRRIQEHFGDVQVVSVGGPTETTVWNIWYPVKNVDPAWNSIPYGHPISNTSYYLLDENLEECAPGQAGEMCCAGVGLLKGYWRNPEQTAGKICIHPRTGERLYRTGDKGRLLPGGDLEFMGRIDRQVKVQGQRIELGEIEAALIRQQGVKQAVVNAVEVAGIKRLIAYIVPERSIRLDAEVLKSEIGRFLPCYMVPTSIVELDALPLNANGKVDHSKLPSPSLGGESRSGAVSFPIAGNSIEQIVLKAWRKRLKLDEISLTQNFFDLGGNSVLLMGVYAELQRDLQKTFPVTDLFQFPTIHSFAQHWQSTESKGANDSQSSERATRQRLAMAQRQALGRSNGRSR